MFARMGDDMDLGDPSAGLGDQPADAHIGQPADLALNLSQVEFVHALEFFHGRNPFPAHCRRIGGAPTTNAPPSVLERCSRLARPPEGPARKSGACVPAGSGLAPK